MTDTKTDDRQPGVYAALVDVLADGGAREPVRPNYSFLDDDALDSFARVRILLDLEDRFGLRIDTERLQDPSVRTVDGLARFIEQSRSTSH